MKQNSNMAHKMKYAFLAFFLIGCGPTSVKTETPTGATYIAPPDKIQKKENPIFNPISTSRTGAKYDKNLLKKIREKHFQDTIRHP